MKRLVRLVMVAVFAVVGVVNADATTIALPTDGTWLPFDVSTDVAVSGGKEWIDLNYNNDGSALAFAFTIAPGFIGQLTVVDTSFAGDTFAVFNNATSLGSTSPVLPQTDVTAPLQFDPDLALANLAFSRLRVALGAGTYVISGALVQSVTDSASSAPLNTTSGDIRVTASPIPEPGTWATLLAGLGLLSVYARRRIAGADHSSAS
ncbi:MAG: PEP-CTERM sorting domain-containing protein [Acidobacteriota bacterium]